jgi:hypothetical protein
MLFFALRAFLIAWQSNRWTPVIATVTRSSIPQFNLGSIGSASLVECEFEVGSRRFVCSQRSIAVQSVSPAGAAEIIRQYPVGSQVTVYFDPRNPMNSVMQPGLNFGSYFVVVGAGIFVWIGIFATFIHKG